MCCGTTPKPTLFVCFRRRMRASLPQQHCSVCICRWVCMPRSYRLHGSRRCGQRSGTLRCRVYCTVHRSQTLPLRAWFRGTPVESLRIVVAHTPLPTPRWSRSCHCWRGRHSNQLLRVKRRMLHRRHPLHKHLASNSPSLQQWKALCNPNACSTAGMTVNWGCAFSHSPFPCGNEALRNPDHFSTAWTCTKDRSFSAVACVLEYHCRKKMRRLRAG